MDPLASLSPTTREWFERAFPGPTPAQEAGWPAIARGGNVLIQAPTGSGKTLAAFLLGLDRLNETPGEGLRLLYVSPLKALNYDIERNLRAPLAGLGSRLTVGVRTGDTPQRERAQMLRRPPDILITTPESLFLLLTSRARELLRSVETVIVDEVHAVAGTKRGAHLALSLERLEAVTERPPQRIGLSATQRPLEEIGRFVAGTGRAIELVDAGTRKELDLEVVVPLDDMRELGADARLAQPVLPDGVEMASGYESNARSIWPSIYPAVLELVRAHRSTIVFVNSRRLAERLALRLNELAGEEIARAHHGSIAREQRVEIEDELKAGRIPCLVATSSLELGIDMGALDLVVQIESPKSVARGLQRVGRAGHELGSVSKGRVFPKFRADLLECAVVAQAMREGAIEETRIPRNPLDVLAQQVVAICADEEITVDDLHALVTRAHPFAGLSRQQLENVLDMLAGRYPSDEFAELRPRIVWDRAAGVIRGRTGVRRLAVTNAGTIPDRGLFGVFQLEGGGRVGELDEEMVYEAREGQTFALGASTWRIEEITRDRVLVSPAPGVPGAVPFWKGEGVGRPYELGERIGRAARALVARTDEGALELLRGEYHLDERAARNLLAYLREQEAATGALPSDRTVVVERFRDEIGDWRVCILTPFGARVHAPWAMALGARLRDALGLEVQSLWSDDGIALHLPDSDAPPPALDLLLDPDEMEDIVVREVGETALFGARFRENAARALLIPRRRPGQRTPLWQQRLKAQSLLQVARKYGSFPIVLETYRECLQDVFDLPALKQLLAALRSRELDLVDVETPSASPFAASLLFDYVATYMYEDDTPAAERRAQALSLDRELLRELLGAEELRELLDPGALADVEASLLPKPRNADDLHDLLRRAGDLRPGESDPGFAETLLRERRALRIRLADDERLIAAEDAGRYRDAFGVVPPGGLPGAFLEPVDDALASVLVRFARSRGPFTSAQAAARYGLALERAEAALAELESAGRLVHGELRPGGTERGGATPTSCAGSAAPRSRCSGARSSPSSRPARPLPASLARHRPPLHLEGGDRPLAGPAAARLAVGVRRAPSPRARLPAVVAGRAVRGRRGRLGRRRARSSRALLPGGRSGARGTGGRAATRGADPCCAERGAARRRPLLARPARGHRTRPCRSSPRPVGTRVGRRGDERCLDAAACRASLRAAPAGPEAPFLPLPAPWGDGDTGPLVVRRRALPRRARPARPRRVAARAAGRGDPRRRARRGNCRRLRRRVRRAARARDHRGLPTWLLRRGPRRRAVRAAGRCRAPPRAARRGGEALVLGAADPAQPYGAMLPWPKRAAARAARVAGAHVVLLDGEAALFVERGGRSLLPLLDPEDDWLRPALAALVGHVRGGGAKRLAVERFDSEPVVESPFLPLLVEAGFLVGPRRAVLRP